MKIKGESTSVTIYVTPINCIREATAHKYFKGNLLSRRITVNWAITWIELISL